MVKSRSRRSLDHVFESPAPLCQQFGGSLFGEGVDVVYDIGVGVVFEFADDEGCVEDPEGAFDSDGVVQVFLEFAEGPPEL